MRSRGSRPNRPQGQRRPPRAATATVEAAPAVAPQVAPTRGQVQVPASITVGDLARLLRTTGVEIIKQLMRTGVMASLNQVVDFDTASRVAAALGFEARAEALPPRELSFKELLAEPEPSTLQGRPPVVTILGHVDHGKTTLLDAIRKSKVAEGEAGGITQHIGAYQVESKGQRVTFLDTPGHEAFTAMRARGAQVTDIAVLVVAADDGVMPQTVEALNHARAAGVPVIVAINKVDKPGANIARVKQQLGEQGLVLEEWGGDVICVPVSAKQRQGVTELLDNILVLAEVLDLKANPDRDAVGVAVEAKLDSTKGAVATILVKAGTLKVGDVVVVGETWGKIKAMLTEAGRRVKEAGPSSPVEVLGLNGVPQAGDTLSVVSDEKAARSLAEERQRSRVAQARQGAKAPTLEEVYSKISAGEVKELALVLKTDVQGSIEPLKTSLERLQAEKVKVKVIHASTGSITESDVLLAIASKAIIIGFNSRPEPGARRLADLEGVDIRHYGIIYNVVEDIQKALTGMLEPVMVEVTEGHAEVKQVFDLGKRGKVAGVVVTDGRVARNARVRVLRGGKAVHQASIASLKHFKDDVQEMTAGFECGIAVDGFNELQVGDILETFRQQKKTA